MFDFDPYAWDFHEDPYPVYRRLREEAPLYRSERLGFWALSRYDDVLAGFKDTEHLSNAKGVSLEKSSHPDPSQTASFLAMDPPRHDRMRSLVARGFTPRQVADLEPTVRAFVRERLPLVQHGGDIVEALFKPLPSMVVAHYLGVPEEDRGAFDGWTEAIVAAGGQGDALAAADAAGEMLAVGRNLEDRGERGVGPCQVVDLLKQWHHGDVVVWGGPSRLAHHGVLTLKSGEHPLAGHRRFNLTLRKAL